MIPHRRAFLLLPLAALLLRGETTVEKPYLGVTHITRTETAPRPVSMHILQVDLTAPGLRFKLTAPDGPMETIRQTTLEFLEQEKAQLAVNTHFFLPFPSTDVNASLIGIAASEGNVYSAFEAPVQSYAIVTDAPGLNIDAANSASIVNRAAAVDDPKRVTEDVTLWNTVSGSAQIITEGRKTIPVYKDAENPDGLLTPGGPANYSNANSWYALSNARTVIGLSEDRRTLTIFTVDRAAGSQGLNLSEAADFLIADYGVHDALNLDGGGSTTLAIRNPATGQAAIVNRSSDSPNGRSVAGNLAIYAAEAP